MKYFLSFLLLFLPQMMQGQAHLDWLSYFGIQKSYYSRTQPTQIIYDSIHHYIYLAGLTSDTLGIATPGAHQPEHYTKYEDMLPTSDIFLSKWDTAGNLIWGTYFGGESAERITNIDLDNEGNIIITGYAQSDTNITTVGVFQEFTMSIPSETINPNNFLAKFSPDGELLWSTYFGLGGSVLYSGLVVDKANNSIYISGNFTNTGAMATDGVHQTTFYGGTTDGFIAKFDAGGNRIWCTYFGGESSDFISNITLSPAGYLYVCGDTKSTMNIASEGAEITIKPTGTDSSSGFIAKFDTTGNRIWSTYIDSDTISDWFFDIKTIGKSDFSEEYIYIYGRVRSSNIATPGTFQPDYAGGTSDMILLKYNQNGNKIWGTYMGGSDEEVAFIPSTSSYLGLNNSLLINGTLGNEEILIVGGTRSTDFYFDGACTYSPTSGNKKGFICSFDNTGNLNWSQPFDEGINSISPIGDNKYVISGITNIDYLATPGSFKDSKDSGSFSGFIGMIDVGACMSSIFEITKIENTLFAPSGFSDYQWYKNGIAIPGADNNFLVLTTTDTGSYSVQFDGDCDCHYESEVYYNYTTSIAPNQHLPIAILYPNPANDKIYLEYGNDVEITDIQLTDILGNKIKDFKPNKKTLNVKDLPSGLYLLNIQTKQGAETKKISIL